MNFVTQSATRVPWFTEIVGGMFIVFASSCWPREPTPPPVLKLR